MTRLSFGFEKRAVQSIYRLYYHNICSWLGDNRFEGPIPDLSNLKSLETLYASKTSWFFPAIGNLLVLVFIYYIDLICSFLPEKKKKKRHLENNRLEGSIPESLGHLPKLRELYVLLN